MWPFKRKDNSTAGDEGEATGAPDLEDSGASAPGGVDLGGSNDSGSVSAAGAPAAEAPVPAAAGVQRAADPSAGDGGIATSGPAPGGEGWRNLPPMQPSFPPMPFIAPIQRFAPHLPTHGNPTSLAPLRHGVSADAPSGTVSGLVKPVLEPAVQRASDLPGHVLPLARPAPTEDGGNGWDTVWSAPEAAPEPTYAFPESRPAAPAPAPAANAQRATAQRAPIGPITTPFPTAPPVLREASAPTPGPLPLVQAPPPPTPSLAPPSVGIVSIAPPPPAPAAEAPAAPAPAPAAQRAVDPAAAQAAESSVQRRTDDTVAPPAEAPLLGETAPATEVAAEPAAPPPTPPAADLDLARPTPPAATEIDLSGEPAPAPSPSPTPSRRPGLGPPLHSLPPNASPTPAAPPPPTAQRAAAPGATLGNLNQLFSEASAPTLAQRAADPAATVQRAADAGGGEEHFPGDGHDHGDAEGDLPLAGAQRRADDSAPSVTAFDTDTPSPVGPGTPSPAPAADAPLLGSDAPAPASAPTSAAADSAPSAPPADLPLAAAPPTPAAQRAADPDAPAPTAQRATDLSAPRPPTAPSAAQPPIPSTPPSAASIPLPPLPPASAPTLAQRAIDPAATVQRAADGGGEEHFPGDGHDHGDADLPLAGTAQRRVDESSTVSFPDAPAAPTFAFPPPAADAPTIGAEAAPAAVTEAAPAFDSPVAVPDLPLAPAPTPEPAGDVPTLGDAAPAALLAEAGPAPSPSAAAATSSAGPASMPLAGPAPSAQRAADPSAADQGIRAQGSGLPRLAGSADLVGAKPPLLAQRRADGSSAPTSPAPATATTAPTAFNAPLPQAPPPTNIGVIDTPPANVATVVQRATGANVGDVRIQRDTGAEAASMGALAFAHEGVVHVPEHHGPLDRGRGAELLAHELTHVAQQRDLGSSRPLEHTPGGQKLEQEAQAVEKSAAGIDPLPLATPPPVQRAADDSAGGSSSADTAMQAAAVAAVQRAAAPLLERGNATMGADGTIQIASDFNPPIQEPARTPPPTTTTTVAAAGSVQRAETGGGGGGGGGGGITDPKELDQLALRLYERLRRMLRYDLKTERERAGAWTDNPL